MIVPKQLANTTEFIFDRCNAGIDVVEATVMAMVRADVVRGRVHRLVCKRCAGEDGRPGELPLLLFAMVTAPN